MSNDSDTIEQVCADLRGHDLIPPPRGAWVMYADRIEKVYDHERRSWDAAIVDQRAINRKLVDEMAAKAEADRIEAAAHELDIENAVAAYAKVVEKKDMELARIILKIRNLSEEIFTFSSILCRGMCERCPSEKDCTSRKCRILIEELRQIANKE